MSSDIAISPVALNNRLGTTVKISYLVYLDIFENKKGNVKKFITIDKPDTSDSFVQMKGIFTEAPDEDIFSSYQSILTSSKKEDIIEIMVPWNRIHLLKSLVFKAK